MKLFKSYSEKEVKRVRPIVNKINSHHPVRCSNTDSPNIAAFPLILRGWVPEMHLVYDFAASAPDSNESGFLDWQGLTGFFCVHTNARHCRRKTETDTNDRFLTLMQTCAAACPEAVPCVLVLWWRNPFADARSANRRFSEHRRAVAAKHAARLQSQRNAPKSSGHSDNRQTAWWLHNKRVGFVLLSVATVCRSETIPESVPARKRDNSFGWQCLPADRSSRVPEPEQKLFYRRQAVHPPVFFATISGWLTAFPPSGGIPVRKINLLPVRLLEMPLRCNEWQIRFSGHADENVRSAQSKPHPRCEVVLHR